MESMSDQKTTLLAELKQARAELWAVLEPIGEDAEIFPGWNKRDFFAHIGAWEAMVYKEFWAYLAGVPVTGNYPFATMDEANAHFVDARRGFTAEDAKLECEINRYAIERMLMDIPAADYDKTVQFPWGGESIVDFLVEAIKHERDHAEEIRQLGQG